MTDAAPPPNPGHAAEPPPTGYSHIWQSKDHDYPCTPTGKRDRGADGRIYVQVRTPDGSQSYVPEDELVPAQDGNGTAKPVPDRETVRRFITAVAAQAKAALEGMEKTGYLQMCRIHPDSDKLVLSRYTLDDVERMIADAIADSEAGHNVYIEGRTVRAGLPARERGKLDDTEAVFALVNDNDADKGMGWTPPASVPLSMRVQSSPGNFHDWIFFQKAVDAKRGQQLGARIRKAVGCDHDTGNVTQPYRVAGTVNYPGKKKREERGRITVPTKIISCNPEVLWTPEEIEQAFPLTNGGGGLGGGGGTGGGDGGTESGGGADEGRIPADTMRVIREGLSPNTTSRHRGQAFWNVMMVLKPLGFTVDEIVNLFERYPNGIAQKYEGRLRKEVERAYNKLSKNESDEDKILAELNRDNMVVIDAARTRVLRFEEVTHEAGGERYVYQLPTFLRFDDFRNFYLNRYVIVGVDQENKPIKRPIGSWWLAHPDRRQYRGVIFTPAGAPVIDGRLNLWRGWGVEPKRGEWGRMREHMRVVLAAGDKAVDDYNFKWCAWTVQHPAEQAEVAPVFRGGLGTGKGTLGKALCRIFGQHSRHLSSPDHMTGKFNAHLRLCCFLFGDECYGPKDRSAEGTMKRLITEPTLQIEPKGRDVVEEPNRLHVMLASNHDWVVPAGAHERRYAVQDVAEIHRQNPNWFVPLYQEMHSGGLEAMLYDLLDYDLGDWHPRQIVRTAALAKQQEQSLEPLDQWWLELLQTGVLEGASEDNPDQAISNEWEEEITDNDGKYERKRTVKHKGLYDQARRISPRLKGTSDTALGLYLRDPERGCTNKWVLRHRGWLFPLLSECREKWKKRFPETVWCDPATTEWTFMGDDEEEGEASKQGTRHGDHDDDDTPM